MINLAVRKYKSNGSPFDKLRMNGDIFLLNAFIAGKTKNVMTLLHNGSFGPGKPNRIETKIFLLNKIE